MAVISFAVAFLYALALPDKLQSSDINKQIMRNSKKREDKCAQLFKLDIS